ncbi:MAG: hypothetical protein ACI37T_08040 [Candidatus Gastranaerophilaceae bacterium]
MNINNNTQQFYKQYIENEKAQQAKMEATAKTAADPRVRAYLEASNKVMGQLNQLDEFVLSSTSQKQKPQGLFGKIKSAIVNCFKK